MMAAYYNEIDPYAAQWLRNLISAGHIAPGEVDERSIVDVQPDDLKGFTQCHFFAGIGGWSLALRIAGWGDDRAVWTGSCPCQPLSVAGKQQGHADERHLWPAFFGLISERGPSVVFGEQVASADGREWLAGIRADLEDVGYACGGADLCAAGVGAPHIRQRIYWMANANDARLEGRREPGRECSPERFAGESGLVGGVAHADKFNGYGGGPSSSDDSGEQRGAPDLSGSKRAVRSMRTAQGFWREADRLKCRDGKWRPVEPGTFPLAHGVPSRVGRIRAYGNAIVPQVAAEVIGAYLDMERETA